MKHDTASAEAQTPVTNASGKRVPGGRRRLRSAVIIVLVAASAVGVYYWRPTVLLPDLIGYNNAVTAPAPQIINTADQPASSVLPAPVLPAPVLPAPVLPAPAPAPGIPDAALALQKLRAVTPQLFRLRYTSVNGGVLDTLIARVRSAVVYVPAHAAPGDRSIGAAVSGLNQALLANDAAAYTEALRNFTDAERAVLAGAGLTSGNQGGHP